jgi:hypothetical protein
LKATFGVSAGAVADDAADGPAKIALKGGRGSAEMAVTSLKTCWDD